ncbi:hypothetical protein TSUD_47750 [Trifolium subterraneum]|nr:hypothetical protein TSUD_47750 [Trifolium subterraneum]
MFMNEFNTVEYSGDQFASPANYLRKLKEIQQFPGTAGMPMAIGLQCHFARGIPNLAYMRSGLDLLGATGLPIWLTETGVDAQPNQVRVWYRYPIRVLCVKEPKRAQYGGGIVVNSGFDHNIKGWTVFGNGTIEKGTSNDGNTFIVASNRTQPLDSFSQKVQLKQGIIYTFSAWFQLSEGSDIVSVVFRINGSDLVQGGHVIAKHGCWSLLKGGIVANYTSPAEILFESENPTVELWADSVSLQPFTIKQWRSHQDNSIERVRKSKVRFQVTHLNETTLEGAKVVIKQTKPNFPFGCAMNSHILTNIKYQKWFVSRFKYTTFTNEMKWYSTEKIQGQENYTIADAMLKFAKQNGISVQYFEEILREAYSHPAVQGIILFEGPAQAGFVYTLLADRNFRNTPSGDVVDKLIKEWGTGPKTTIADSRGIVDISLHHGDYDVTITHPLTQYSKKLNVSVRNGFSPDTIHVKMNA